MVKSTWKMASKDSPIFSGRPVISSGGKRKGSKVPPKERRTSQGFPVVDKSELERRGDDTSDDYIISLGQTKRPK